MSIDRARLEELRKLVGDPDVASVQIRTSVDLGYKRVSALPLGVGLLTRLAALYLHTNQLSSLPPEISHLTGLTYLNVCNNPVRASVRIKWDVDG